MFKAKLLLSDSKIVLLNSCHVLYMYKTYISLHHIHSARPHDLDITRHIDCVFGFALLTQGVKRNVCPSASYPSAYKLYRVSIHVTSMDISAM